MLVENVAGAREVVVPKQEGGKLGIKFYAADLSTYLPSAPIVAPLDLLIQPTVRFPFLSHSFHFNHRKGTSRRVTPSAVNQRYCTLKHTRALGLGKLQEAA